MINLLPDDIKENMNYGRKNRQIINWITTALFGVIVLFIIAAVGRLTIQTARDQALAQKQNMEEQLKIADYEQVSDEYGDYVDGLSSVKKLYGQQILYTRLIRKLGTVLPAGARLTNISLSDKDRAIGLNFDNDTDGLGPVIQLNLTDQSKQVAEKTRLVFGQNLRTPVTGSLDASSLPTITSNSEEKTITFYVHSPNQSLDTRLGTAVKSGGDMAFMASYNALESGGNLDHYKYLQANKTGTMLPETSQPQIRSYKVLSNIKAVDFTIAADSLDEAKQLERTLLDTNNTLFIETYSFESSTHANKNKCKDEVSGNTVCEPVCKTSDCSGDKICRATTKNGCRYVIRAYYDELYTSASVKELSPAEKTACNQSNPGPSCTHQVTATYSQLFSKVDINRVSACTVDATTGASACPVEMRAEFSADAKFYLINSGGTK